MTIFPYLFQILNINYTKAFLRQEVENRVMSSLVAYSGFLDTYRIAWLLRYHSISYH